MLMELNYCVKKQTKTKKRNIVVIQEWKEELLPVTTCWFNSVKCISGFISLICSWIPDSFMIKSFLDCGLAVLSSEVKFRCQKSTMKHQRSEWMMPWRIMQKNSLLCPVWGERVEVRVLARSDAIHRLIVPSRSPDSLIFHVCWALHSCASRPEVCKHHPDS